MQGNIDDYYLMLQINQSERVNLFRIYFISSLYHRFIIEDEYMGNENVGNYSTVHKLRKGRYGKTRVCRTIDNYLNAIKIYQLLPGYHLLDIIDQYKTFVKNQIKWTVKIKEVIVVDSDKFGVIMDYYEGANLAANLQYLPLLNKVKLMKQIALVVQTMHQKYRIPHRNLKPENLFIIEGEVYVSDLTAPCFSFLRVRQSVGSFDYQAPQTYQGVNSFDADIWSLGVIFIEILKDERIRNLEMISQSVVKPSIRGLYYPHPQIINEIQNVELNYLIKKMVDINPQQRIKINEVVSLLDSSLNNTQKKPLTTQHFNMIGNILSLTTKQDIKQRYFDFEFDIAHPCINYFHFSGRRVERVDREKRRYQAVSKESIPFGRWFVTARVNNYGIQNDQVVFGVLSQERRRQKMSGDIQQDNSISIWTSLASGHSNLCENGVWSSTPLPLLRERDGILKIIVDTAKQKVEWFIDNRHVSTSTIPKSYWNQLLYVFVGLKGQNCEVQFGDQNQFNG